MVKKPHALNGFFITGTDTGVGKTVVTAALTALFRQAGQNALPVKPVQTGCRQPSLKTPPDVAEYLRLTGLAVPSATLKRMNTYCFRPACSPHLAAARSGARIVPGKILRDLHMLQAQADLLIVEGAGGAYVPLNSRHTMLDLMRLAGMPVIIVSRLGLGAINHALLTIEAVRRAGLNILGIIFNQLHPQRLNYIEANNRQTIPQRAGVPLLGTLPYLPDIAHMTPAKFLHYIKPTLRRCLALAW